MLFLVHEMWVCRKSMGDGLCYLSHPKFVLELGIALVMGGLRVCRSVGSMCVSSSSWLGHACTIVCRLQLWCPHCGSSHLRCSGMPDVLPLSSVHGIFHERLTVLARTQCHRRCNLAMRVLSLVVFIAIGHGGIFHMRLVVVVAASSELVMDG